MAEPTKEDLLKQAADRNIEVPDDATKAQIQDLLDKAEAPSADVAVNGQHPNSIVEPVPDDEKPGPSSVMSREITPAERDLPPGTSALQAPAAPAE